MKAFDAAKAERERQVSAKNYTPEHDDSHKEGELAVAAACYATPHPRRQIIKDETGEESPPFQWPFEAEAWRPTPNNRKREIVKAMALLAAEYERLDRAPAIERNEKILILWVVKIKGERPYIYTTLAEAQRAFPNEPITEMKSVSRRNHSKNEGVVCDDVYWSEHWQCWYARWTDGFVEPLRDQYEAREKANEWKIRLSGELCTSNTPKTDASGLTSPILLGAVGYEPTGILLESLGNDPQYMVVTEGIWERWLVSRRPGKPWQTEKALNDQEWSEIMAALKERQEKEYPFKKLQQGPDVLAI